MKTNIPFSAKLQIISSIVTSEPNVFRITGLFSDSNSNFSVDIIEINDMVIDNSGNIFPIISIENQSNLLVLNVMGEDFANNPINGAGAIFRQYDCEIYPQNHSSLPLDLRYKINNHNMWNIYRKICSVQQDIIQINGSVDNENNFVMVSSDYLLNLNDNYILADTSNNDIHITLPIVGGDNGNFHIKKISPNNNVYISSADDKLIDGQINTIIFGLHDFLRFKYINNAWYIF